MKTIRPPRKSTIKEKITSKREDRRKKKKDRQEAKRKSFRKYFYERHHRGGVHGLGNTVLRVCAACDSI